MSLKAEADKVMAEGEALLKDGERILAEAKHMWKLGIRVRASGYQRQWEATKLYDKLGEDDE